jgi:hypothetical protein
VQRHDFPPSDVEEGACQVPGNVSSQQSALADFFAVSLRAIVAPPDGALP